MKFYDIDRMQFLWPLEETNYFAQFDAKFTSNFRLSSLACQ